MAARSSPHAASHFVALLVAVAAPSPASACRCAEPRDTAAAYRASTLVVAGKVVGVDRSPAEEGLSYRIEVLRSWKGDVARELVVSTGSDCGFHAEIGGDYLLFLAGTGAGLTTGRCMGNGALASRRGAVTWLQRQGRAGKVGTAR